VIEFLKVIKNRTYTINCHPEPCPDEYQDCFRIPMRLQNKPSLQIEGLVSTNLN